jgi:hypothetical protein
MHWLVIAGLAMGLVLGGFSAAPGVARAETQDALLKRGIDLRIAGDDEGALREFKKAYAMSPTPKATAQMGLAEQALGRWEDADLHLTEAMHAAEDPWITLHRKTLDDAVTVIKQHVARVEVVAEPAGAEILINGHVVGTAPLPASVRVSAGEVSVEARASGYTPAAHAVHVVGGQYQSVVLRLEKVGVAEEPKKVPPDFIEREHEREPAEATSSARPVLKWTALGLGGAGLVTGIAATFIHETGVSDFDKAANGTCADRGGTGVHQDTEMPAPECQGPLDTYRHARIAQIVGFVAAGAFTTTWLVLALTEPTEPPKSALPSPRSSGGSPTLRTAHTARWVCLPALGSTQISCALTF